MTTAIRDPVYDWAICLTEGISLPNGASKTAGSQATKSSPAASLKHQIVQHLPYLRRYARALTGSQTVGDEYIRGCLETLLHQPEFMTAGNSVPVQLFKLFHKFADTVESSTDDIAKLADPVERRVGERLIALAPVDRQALLLVHQEGFSQSEAAEILGFTGEEVARRIDDAWANLKRQPATSVLIIEDEPVIALDVAESVKSLGHTVTGVANRAILPS